MKTFTATPADIDKKWIIVDAEGVVLGRLASIIAMRLRGKHKPTFTPHMDMGDNVIVINAEKVQITGNKREEKNYWHTGHPGGIKFRTTGEILDGKHPERVVTQAVKRMLPDSHTDFAFSVLAEEFGIVTCALLAAIFAFIVIRGLQVALVQRDVFNRLAIAGLVLLFGLQSIINMAVNLQLMPAKGMTLPFISYGGSSMLAVAVSAGFILALTRRRPENRSHTDRLLERTWQMHSPA